MDKARNAGIERIQDKLVTLSRLKEVMKEVKHLKPDDLCISTPRFSRKLDHAIELCENKHKEVVNG